MKKLFTIILILFIILGAVGFWYWEKNQYSKETLNLEILGPKAAQSGHEVEYTVSFKNTGSVRLEEPKLVFEFPDQSIPSDEQPQRISKDLEAIYPGEERTFSFKARIFGKKGYIALAKAWLSYRPKGLKARFESKTEFSTQIDFVPLTLEFDLPQKTSPGEEIKFSLNYFSNIDFYLQNLRIKVDYPQGFTFQSANPQPLDKNIWDIPGLVQADGGRIEIKGLLGGRENEQKVFRAQLGLFRNGEFWVLQEDEQVLKLSAASLYISQLINGVSDYKVRPGDLLHYQVFYKNIGSRPIQKRFLFVELEGELFDLSSLRSAEGQCGRGDNTIIWDWKDVPSLRFLAAGQESKVDFWVRTKRPDELASKITNPVLRDKISIGGREQVFDLKIQTIPAIVQKVYFQEEFFGNSGPLPPKIGTSTTYTVLWQVSNTWNKLEGVKVKTVLPDYVNPTGKIFPEDAKFTFDSDSREVIWNIGDVPAWLGANGLPETIAFQIEFSPQEGQRGTAPLLVDRAELSGKDVFTGDVIKIQSPGVDTTLPDDQTVTEKGGIVK